MNERQIKGGVGTILSFHCPHCANRVEIGVPEDSITKFAAERDALREQVASEEAAVKRLRAAILGAPRVSIEENRSGWCVVNIAANGICNGDVVAFVRLDGLELTKGDTK